MDSQWIYLKRRSCKEDKRAINYAYKYMLEISLYYFEIAKNSDGLASTKGR